MVVFKNNCVELEDLIIGLSLNNCQSIEYYLIYQNQKTGGDYRFQKIPD